MTYLRENVLSQYLNIFERKFATHSNFMDIFCFYDMTVELTYSKNIDFSGKVTLKKNK